MKTCWAREQLQPEMVKGKLQEEDNRYQDPARQAGWQKPGRHVTSQVGTGSQNEVVCVYNPFPPCRHRPPQNPKGLHLAGRAPRTMVSCNSGERREQVVAANRVPHRGPGGHSPGLAPRPSSPTPKSELGRPREPPPPQPDPAPEEQAGHGCPRPPVYRPGPIFSQGRPTSRCGAARHRESPRRKGAEMVPAPWCPACSASALPSPPP